MIYITGDTHAEFSRFNTRNFPEQKEMTRDDIVIICGDFGGVWHDCAEERYWLDWLNNKPFTLVYVDGNHECMHKDTEILTDKGWVNIEKAYNNLDEYLIASVNLDNKKISYSKPLEKICKYAERLIHFNGSNYSQCVTPNHDVIVNGVKMKAKEAAEIGIKEQDFRFEINDEDDKGINLSNEVIELLTAIIMDATIVDYKKYSINSEKVRIQFHFKKLRKIIYIQNLLELNNINYTIRTQTDGSTYINIYSDDARYLYGLLNKKKMFPDSWRNLNKVQLRYLLNALVNTDGTVPTSGTIIKWRTISKNDVDLLTELCVKHNYDINIRLMDKNISGYQSDKPQYDISIGKNKKLNTRMSISNIEYNDYVYCFTMQNGTLITRYNLIPCITGNCFTRYYNDEFPVVDFHGGKAHQIRDNIYHLMRGYIFDFEGKSFFCMGGASSHDIWDGILDPDDYPSEQDFIEVYHQWNKERRVFRVNKISWWQEEIPSDEELERGYKNLEERNFKVDYVISHCLPQEIAFEAGGSDSDKLTLYFEKLLQHGLKFKHWYAGHYHIERRFFSVYDVLYYKIIRIL